MDKQTLSNYGWIVIAVLVLCVMIAMATPFGKFIEGGIRSTTQGLFDVEQNALGAAGMVIGDNSFANSSGNGVTPPVVDNLPPDTDTMIYRLSSLDPNITYTDFEITNSDYSHAKIGYTNTTTDLVIPVAFKDGDTWYKVTSIGRSAFGNYTSLTSVIIPDSVTSIGSHAFRDCTSLTSVTFGENSQLTSIDEYAFLYCASITNIDIPDSVTSIGREAFYNVQHITYNGAALDVLNTPSTPGAPWGAKSIN